jgi:sugar transferase (PEP-CTERM/EpsH1 system associated)
VKVLYLCHRIPYPPNKGEKIRAFHQIRAIAARHEVDLFTLADRAEDVAEAAALERHCRRVTAVRLLPLPAKLRALPSLFGRTPLTLPYFYSAELHKQIRSAIAERGYDRIVVYCSAMAQYTTGVTGIPMVVDFVDVDSEKWRQYASATRFPYSAVYRREASCLREYERQVCERAACAVASTEREAQLLREISPAAPVTVIRNGVDTGYFSPSAVPPCQAQPMAAFVGDMSYFPNQQAAAFFAAEVLPLVQRSVPEARFVIVGRDPTPAVRRLERFAGVEVTGAVEDVRPYLARAVVSVAPFLIAAGIQNKILEAMSYGLPVAATPPAVRGLSPQVGQIVEVGENADELAAKIVALMQDGEAARRKGLEGRRRVSAEYSWPQALESLLQLVENPTNGAALAAAAPADGLMTEARQVQ